MAQKTKTIRLPQELNEISGLENLNDSILIAINDSGNSNEIYFINLKGEILKKTKVYNTKNIDWEDLTMDPKGNLYIADVGNNDNSRKDLCVIKVNANKAFQQDSIAGEFIHFKYEDQEAFPPVDSLAKFDCEAIYWRNNEINLVSKLSNKKCTAKPSIYSLPTQAGNFNIHGIEISSTSYNSKLKNQITSADYNEHGYAFLTYKKIILLKHQKSSTIKLKAYAQREAMILLNEKTIIVASEQHFLLGGPSLTFITLK